LDAAGILTVTSLADLSRLVRGPLTAGHLRFGATGLPLAGTAIIAAGLPPAPFIFAVRRPMNCGSPIGDCSYFLPHLAATTF
jgi:hypothetical protein